MNATAPAELQDLLHRLFQAEDIDDLDLDLADQAVTKFPDAPEALQARAFIRLGVRDRRGANEDLQAAQKLHPSHVGHGWIQCVMALERGPEGHAEALSHGQAVLAREPGHFGALVALARLFETQRQVNDAVDHWRRAIQARPRSFRAHNALIKLLCANGRHADAIELIRHADVPMHSNGMAIEYNMGTLLLHEHPAKAIEFLDTARRRMGEVNNVQHNRAHCLETLGRYQEAVEEWDNLLLREPDWDWPLLGRARSLAQLGRFDEAVADIRHLQKIQPGDPEVTRAAAGVFYEKGDHAAALEALQALDALQRIDNEYLNNLMGATYLHLGELEKARPWFVKAIGLQPDSYRAHKNLAACLLKPHPVPRADAREAIGYAEIAISLRPNLWLPRELRIKALMALDRKDEARQMFENWLAEHPSDMEGRQAYALHLLNEGGASTALAAAQFEKLMSLHGEDPYYAWGLGKALGFSGQVEKGKVWLNKAMQQYQMNGESANVLICVNTLAELDKPKSLIGRLFGRR